MLHKRFTWPIYYFGVQQIWQTCFVTVSTNLSWKRYIINLNTRKSVVIIKIFNTCMQSKGNLVFESLIKIISKVLIIMYVTSRTNKGHRCRESHDQHLNVRKHWVNDYLLCNRRMTEIDIDSRCKAVVVWHQIQINLIVFLAF